MGISTPNYVRAKGVNINLPTLREITGCCGAGGFAEIAENAGEIYGIYILQTYSPAQKAIFALWLNDNPGCWKSVVVAVSAERLDPSKWNRAELVLFESGFTPVSRSLNRNHAPGHITLWFIELTKSTMLPIPEEFQLKKKVKRAVSRTD